MENKFDILFQPLKIGPVTAPNRFYQVPHCNGMGYRMPRALAKMRGIKAEGGWGVVCTEEVEIHHSSDLSSSIEGRLWSYKDIPALALMAYSVHEHGALAGIQLVYSGHNASNLYSRSTGFGPRSVGVNGFHPRQTRRMDKEDIRNLRRWHRAAAIRAKKAGFDIIYCYAGHNLALPMHFLLKRYNDRMDEYGGSLENRARLLRELIEDTKDAVGDTCAVAVRLAVDELLEDEGISSSGEGHDIIAHLAELPDIWDVNISGWENDSATARFKKEGYQEKYINFVKKLTTKPVVGVGRYTTPDAMLSVVERGIVDFVGAARPSIADPFLPQKIKEDRIEDIRECIGCNICVSADNLSVPIRCTQNPTMGEEWRRGWHPERIHIKKQDKEILVVGGGPAGLEAARVLGVRGYDVLLLEKEREFGGRVICESALPGLIEWRRVADWRLTQIEKMKNVSLYPSSPMSVDDILETGIKDVIIATGASWRKDGLGRHQYYPISGYSLPNVFTPDDLMGGKMPTGHVLIYDDDHYYMGSVLAELLHQQGCEVSIATPAPQVAYWSQYTLEQGRIHQKMLKADIKIFTQKILTDIQPKQASLLCSVSGQKTPIDIDSVLLLTDSLSNDALYQALKPSLKSRKLNSLKVIGDAEAPGIIADAVFSGYKVAYAMDGEVDRNMPFKVERVRI
ncbi:MAG: FAD-dependent oxidoreductase [Anaerolineae bacterium]|jgi:dimethylamine/trimethylamine dehydrogenase|nr:FAD-dependent oxidoreductase [Anaerolineae bacterium]MBT7189057.1 FAD-dependent oxidoreductase [Anaerolineae bacterium]MBT7990330.1 FAD-dependent oxidoreductase [Anaerolineae bacterium]